MPADRTTTAVPAARRSAFPQLAGVSAGFAVLIAVTATLAGFALEAGAGHSELGVMFAGCYAVGCIAAVLLVRQSGVFTAVIQPPLLLFVAVPLAYFLFHGSESSGLKGILITCGYPLIERFPLMFFTSVTVLVIGMVRWYSANSHTEGDVATASAEPERAGLLRSLLARFTAERPPRHGIDRSVASPRTARRARYSERDSGPDLGRDPGRSRRPRPERAQDPGRRREPGRRPLPTDARSGAPRQRTTRDPRPTRDPRFAPDPRMPRGVEQPTRRAPRERTESYRPRPGRGGHESYGSRDSRYAPQDRYPADPPRTQRPRTQGPRTQGPRPIRDDTHHPVSRVRYRGDGPDYPEHPPRR